MLYQFAVFDNVGLLVEDLGASRKATRAVRPFILVHGLEQQVFRHFGEELVLHGLKILEDAPHFMIYALTVAIASDIGY